MFDFIKKWEGFREKAYKDAVGRWTIGYGQTKIDGRSVKEGDVLTKEQADALWEKQVAPYANAVRLGLRVPVNANQFEALTSFAYNHGIQSERLRKLLIAVNSGNKNEIRNKIMAGTTAGGKFNQGLANRRAAEWTLYNT